MNDPTVSTAPPGVGMASWACRCAWALGSGLPQARGARPTASQKLLGDRTLPVDDRADLPVDDGGRTGPVRRCGREGPGLLMCPL